MDDYEPESTHRTATKASLTFLLEDIDPRDLVEDGLSLADYGDSDSEAGGGVRETPSCQELAIEGERLAKQGEHSEAIPLLEAALELGTDDERLASVLWSLLGNAHFYLGNYKQAAACHMHDLAVSNESGDEKSKAQAYCNLGIAYRKTGYLRRAKACYEYYLEICEKLEEGRSISKASHNLGELHLSLARLKLQRDGGLEESAEAKEHLDKAAEYFERHLEYATETNSQASIARVHGSLGMVYELLRDTDRAIDHHQQRLQIATELADRASEGRAYCSIGNCLRAIIQPDKALECYKRAKSIADELEDRNGMSVCYCNIGTTYELLSNLEEALEHHEKHLELTKETNNLRGQSLALSNISKTYECMANITKACEALESLSELQKQLKDERELSNTVAQLVRLNDQRESSPQTGKRTTPAAPVAGAGTGGGVIKGTWKKLKEKRKKRNSAYTEPPTTPGDGAESSDKKGTAKQLTTPTAPKGSKPKKTKETVPAVSKELAKANDETSNSAEETSLSRSGSKEERSKTDSLGRKSTDIEKTSEDVTQDVDLSEHSKMPSSESTSFVDSDQNQAEPQIVVIEDHPDLTTANDRESVELTSPLEETDSPHDDQLETVYERFGDETHRRSLHKVHEFLESTGEHKPVDMTVLHDWDGWTIASRDVVVQSSKESKLI